MLLDLVRFYTESGAPLPYNPWTKHGISVAELEACAKKQGVQFREGDILLLRVGFIQRYYNSSQDEKDELSTKPETLYDSTLHTKSSLNGETIVLGLNNRRT